MLDSVTKKGIDVLRNILVGKIPDPKSQVEQITTGLIYKFMHDMDEEAVQMGGVPSFFTGEFKKYAWNNLFDPKLGGADKVQLYSDAIEGMYTNPTAPPLFREIFKNSFLPFKDPSTLNMFLKEINEFHYSHSEKLGDAFEYLLSFMGSQGDAGQFRTPRHIIDIIVAIVNPQKNEEILDPACGTAGFLISSFKHILNQNTDKKPGDRLTAAERKKVGDNLVGYDISPDMTRISLVNMYLHQFASPLIHEYDTLSSEDRWNEYYDVILANPPFFSPTGGIQPHSRFGVQSTRAEVLFTDYIIEHLKPNGRAGIVVPEGIIFQSGTAYKTLRKKLVEGGLVGVISLPAGVFQPYSGVKTSILILDKELHQKTDNIFFAKIENDGFSLGSQRNAISKNDLPNLLQEFEKFTKGSKSETDSFWIQKKSDILQNKIHSLVGGNYKKVTVENSEWELTSVGEVCNINQDSCDPLSLFGEGSFIYVDISSVDNGTGNIHLDNRISTGDAPSRAKRRVRQGDVLVSSVRPNLKGFGLVDFDATEVVVSTGFLVLTPSDKVLPKYLLHNLLSQNCIQQMSSRMGRGNYPSINSSDIKEVEIPLPPIDIQQGIVDELEGYQKIIDGCRQVVENYKPTIDIDSSWEMVELGEVATLKYGLGESAEDLGTHRFIRITDINEFGLLRPNDKKYISIDDSQKEYVLARGDVLMARTGATFGKCLYFEGSEPSVFAGYLIKIYLNEKIIPKFFWIFSQSSNFNYQKKQLVVGGGQPQFNANTLKNVVVPIPSIAEQRRIIEEVIGQQSIVEGNHSLIASFEQKIQNRISKVWGD